MKSATRRLRRDRHPVGKKYLRVEFEVYMIEITTALTAFVGNSLQSALVSVAWIVLLEEKE